MNKAEIIQLLAQKSGIPQAKAKEVFEDIIDAWTTALKNGDTIAIAGFGNFKPKTRAARNGINPKTKEAIKIPAKKAVSFSSAKQLKDALN